MSSSTRIPAAGSAAPGSWTPAGKNGAPARLTGAPRQRRVPYLLVGILLVLGCAAAGVVVALRLGHRVPALELARPVSVGQALTTQDVREVDVSAGTGLAVIPARSLAQVVGRPVAYSLPAGTLLTRQVLGAAQVPPAGQAVAAVGLKAGQVPSGLQPGNHVTVVVEPDSNAASGKADEPASLSWDAVVTNVKDDATDQTTVVSMQMAVEDARQLAAVPAGQVDLVETSGGGQ